jgi:hypothetical protein
MDFVQIFGVSQYFFEGLTLAFGYNGRILACFTLYYTLLEGDFFNNRFEGLSPAQEFMMVKEIRVRARSLLAPR